MIIDYNIDKNTKNLDAEILNKVLLEKLLKNYSSDLEDDSVDIWKPMFLKSAAEFVSKMNFPHDENSSIMKLLVHPEYEVRLSILNTLRLQLSSHSPPLLPAKDLISLIFCEKHDQCLEGLLSCCSLLPKSDLSETDQVPFLVSLIESSNNDDIRTAALRLSSKLLQFVSDPTTKLSWTTTVRECCSPEETTSVREAAANAILENVDMLKQLPKSGLDIERNCCILMWSSLLTVMWDDDDSVRSVMTKVNAALHDGLREVHSTIAAEQVIEAMMRLVGRAWPSAVVLLVLGHLLTTLFDSASAEDVVSAENDRTFDKGEMNIFQELVTMTKKMLPPLAKQVSKLSPRLQKITFEGEMSRELMSTLLPELPGAVHVYSIGQLVEYLAARSCEDCSDPEAVMMLSVFTSMKCRYTDEVCCKFFKTWMGSKGKRKNTNFLIESFNGMISKTLSQCG
jgi:hypothetical protein